MRAGCGTSHCDGSTSFPASGLRIRVSWLSPSSAISSVAHVHATTRGHPAHAERQTEAGENIFDLIERLPSEVLGGEHLALGPLYQIPERTDVGILEAVRGTDGEVELFDRLGQHLGHARIDFRSCGF